MLVIYLHDLKLIIPHAGSFNYRVPVSISETGMQELDSIDDVLFLRFRWISVSPPEECALVVFGRPSSKTRRYACVLQPTGDHDIRNSLDDN